MLLKLLSLFLTQKKTNSRNKEFGTLFSGAEIKKGKAPKHFPFFTEVSKKTGGSYYSATVSSGV